jgi:hypothetical protein
VLALRLLEVIEVLLQRRIVELGQELGLDRDVDPADVVDELTFIHGVFTFAKDGFGGATTATNHRCPRYGIGQVVVST